MWTTLLPTGTGGRQIALGHLHLLFEIQKLCTAAVHAQGFQPSLQPKKSYLFVKAAELQQLM